MEEIYKQLNINVGMAGSIHLPKIWQMLCTEEELKTAVLLPGTPQSLAAKTGGSAEEISALLDSLFKKGAAFRTVKNGQTLYRLPRNIIQFHDACLLWEGADEEFFAVWKKIMDEEFTSLMKNLPEGVKLPPFMRVVPINETIDMRSSVLTYEECEKMIHNSAKVAVVRCPCRLSQKNCDAPLENCLQINRGAEYVLDRGHGREISKEEAVRILKDAEKAGLVHMQENRSNGNAICNCCPCCCEMFRLAEKSGKDWILSPSRYLAVVDSNCTACGSCEDICPVAAITVEDAASVDALKCVGCGLCAVRCPEDAISLKAVREEGHIPA